MELRQLKHFLTVAELGSFARAAHAQNLTPQALSKSIAALEDSLGVRLLDRTSRHATPTRFGELLLAHAAAITSEAGQFQRRLDDLLGVKATRLLVGTGVTTAGPLMASTVSRFASLFPRVTTSVTEATTPALLTMLLRGEVDVVIGVLADQFEDKMVEQETLFHERLYFMAGSGHPLASATSIRLEQITDYPWIAGKDGYLFPKLLNSFDKAQLPRPGCRISTQSPQFARAVLRRNEHLCLLEESIFLEDIELGLLAKLAVDVDMHDWTFPVKLFYRRQSARSSVVTAFVTALRASVQNRHVASAALRKLGLDAVAQLSVSRPDAVLSAKQVDRRATPHR